MASTPHRRSGCGLTLTTAVRPLGRSERDGDQDPRLARHHERRWRYVAGGAGEEYGFHGGLHEVAKMGGPELHLRRSAEGVSLETLPFQDLGDSRTRLHAPSLVDSFEGRDHLLARQDRVDEGYAKLDALVAER